MTTTNRFLMPGGLAAALTCLVLTACGQPGSMDSGMMMPPPDAYMPTGDGGMDVDAYVPPDHDSGPPDVDAGTDAAAMMCTAEMMATRVTPPCDPDNNASGPGTAPSWLTSHFGFTHDWASPMSSGCSTGTGVDSMGLAIVRISCPETDIDPCHGVFHYSDDGSLNCNAKNKDLIGSQGDWQRILPAADHMSATLEVYDGGSSTPRMTISLWEI